MNPDFSDLTPGARVVVAMSGGVDSSVTAALLVEAGYEVVGITLQLYDIGAAASRPGSCCADRDIHDARRVADTLGIAHYVLDFEDRFRASVIDDFVDSYLNGETPIPCVRCNQTVKFRDLLQRARDLGAEALATGHYVQRLAGPSGAELHRGADPSRDQSYFLFATTQRQLDFLRFPIGNLPKDAVRAHAQRLGLAVADKPDSQDICFVPQGGYASVVEKFRPGALEAGDIVHVGGEVLGRHDGIINFTVGQRRGLGIGGGAPLYVVAVDPASRRVIVGPPEALLGDRVTIRDLNWLAGPQTPVEQGARVTVKLRSQSEPAPATLTISGDGAATVRLDAPQAGIAPGQACVAYQGDRLLGGGWIARRDRAIDATAA
jgi:tRNA-specific 2-thiouridylase